ncbi:MAG: polymer-forming cytoskeletal protein [Deltaproteobacteria bacterium]|nr:polymer-forming cytoskeletal protein [Deltaproteobacteria bacterium]
MRDTKGDPADAGIPTLIEAGTRFEGLVSFRGTVRVEGVVVGEVIAEGTLVVAERGELRGRVETDEVLVEGCCEGDIAARDRIELRPSARVRGRLEAPRLQVVDGSVFDGQWHAGAARTTGPDEAVAAPLPEPAKRPSDPPDPA